jgi:hypothetical protein
MRAWQDDAVRACDRAYGVTGDDDMGCDVKRAASKFQKAMAAAAAVLVLSATLVACGGG